jgi:hypothetical protein
MNRKFDGTLSFAVQDSNYPAPLAALANGADNVRISKRVAQEWIIHQQSVIYQATVYYLEIAHTGIGTYLVRRAPRDWGQTQMVKGFLER